MERQVNSSWNPVSDLTISSPNHYDSIVLIFLPLETNYPSLAYEQPQNSPVSPPEQKSISLFSRMP